MLHFFIGTTLIKPTWCSRYRGPPQSDRKHDRSQAQSSPLGKVEPLYEKVAKRLDGLASLDTLPLRHAHGDLKVTNIRFDGSDETRVAGILDLDTFAQMPLIFEMGDAFRSWCNTATEDDAGSTFDAAVFSHGSRGWWSILKEVEVDAMEVENLVSGIEWITLELTTRFLRDALEESYFLGGTIRFSAVQGNINFNGLRSTSPGRLH